MYDAITVPILIPLLPDEAAEAEGYVTVPRGSKTPTVPVRPFRDDEWTPSAAKPWNDMRLSRDVLTLWGTLQRPQVREARRQSPGKAERVLSERLSWLLDSVSLLLWWNEKERRFLPALYCAGGVSDAALVRTLLTIVAGGNARGLRVCPHCSKLFMQSDPRQDWCSNACGNAIRVAEWRAKQKKRQPKKSRRTSQKRGG